HLDNLANVKRIHCPILVFHGDADRLPPPPVGLEVGAGGPPPAAGGASPRRWALKWQRRLLSRPRWSSSTERATTTRIRSAAGNIVIGCGNSSDGPSDPRSRRRERCDGAWSRSGARRHRGYAVRPPSHPR